MRINTNVSSMIASNALSNNQKNDASSLEKLSTGLRINRAADDSAGLGVSENLQAQVNGTNQAKQNAQDGVAALNIADGAAGQITDILQRMRELAVQSSNDTLTTKERAYSDTEFQQLSSEITRIAQVTNYNGQTLLNGNGFGAVGSQTLQIDANNAAQDQLVVTINKVDATTLAVNAAKVTTQTDSAAAITSLDGALDKVNSMRATVGAYTNRLNHAITNLDTSNTNQASAESTIRDVDFSTETASFTKNQILTQSATAMLAQANQIPQGVLKLLQ
jgi:flagellin